MKKIKNYLVNLPLKNLFKINSIALGGFCIYLIFLNDKIKSTDLTFLIITPLIWCGGTFFLLTLLIKYLDKEYPKTLLKKLMVVLYLILIPVSFFGPIVCYIMVKYYELQIEQLKQAMHHT